MQQLAASAARIRGALAALIAVTWCVALTWLVLATANPVTLNRRQLLDADAIVTAQIIDLATGKCRIVKQWSGAALADEIAVSHLEETAAQPGGDWIMPLFKAGSEWEVAPTALPSHARLIYPATPEALQQLDAILNP